MPKASREIFKTLKPRSPESNGRDSTNKRGSQAPTRNRPNLGRKAKGDKKDGTFREALYVAMKRRMPYKRWTHHSGSNNASALDGSATTQATGRAKKDKSVK